MTCITDNQIVYFLFGTETETGRETAGALQGHCRILSEQCGGGTAGGLSVQQRGGRPEHAGCSLCPDQLHQTAGLVFLVSEQTEVSEPLLLLPPPLPRHPRPPHLQLVVPQLLGVVPGNMQVTWRECLLPSYFSKLLTMMGKGSDMVRAPLMAQKVPTSLPTPLTG